MKYHINENNEVKPCHASVKPCQFAHNGSRDEMERVAAEVEAADIEAASAPLSKKRRRVSTSEEPMSTEELIKDALAIVEVKNSTWDDGQAWEESDGFYNVIGEQDPEGIDAMARYHYASKAFKYDSAEVALSMHKLLSTKSGAHMGSTFARSYISIYEQLKHCYDNNLDVRIDNAEFDMPAYRSLSSELCAEDELRVSPDKNDPVVVSSYLQDSAEWSKKLTPKEQNAAAYWTGCGSSVAYQCMTRGRADFRGYQSTDEKDDDYFDAKSYVEQVNSALEKSTLKEPVVVYRGMREGIVGREVIEEFYNNYGKPQCDDLPVTSKWIESNYPVGKELEFTTPQSASHSPTIAEGFSDGVVLEIKASKAAPVGVLSSWGVNELEYIVPSSTKYKVLGHQTNAQYETTLRDGKKEKRRVTVVQLEQLP